MKRLECGAESKYPFLLSRLPPHKLMGFSGQSESRKHNQRMLPQRNSGFSSKVIH
jgi:hypothetical protein